MRTLFTKSLSPFRPRQVGRASRTESESHLKCFSVVAKAKLIRHPTRKMTPILTASLICYMFSTPWSRSPPRDLNLLIRPRRGDRKRDETGSCSFPLDSVLLSDTYEHQGRSSLSRCCATTRRHKSHGPSFLLLTPLLPLCRVAMETELWPREGSTSVT